MTRPNRFWGSEVTTPLLSMSYIRTSYVFDVFAMYVRSSPKQWHDIILEGVNHRKKMPPDAAAASIRTVQYMKMPDTAWQAPPRLRNVAFDDLLGTAQPSFRVSYPDLLRFFFLFLLVAW